MSDQSSNRRRIRLLVAGRVQGVWFRASTREEALRLGLTGFVRNLPDGRVEIVAEGDEAALEALTSWCSVGPPEARVDAVVASEPDDDRPLVGFSVRR